MGAKKISERRTDYDLLNFINENRIYQHEWDFSQDNSIIQSILDKSSKRRTGNSGYLDLIYKNEQKRILVLVENKKSVKVHNSQHGKPDPEKYAVDGIKHYLSFFTEGNLNKEKDSVKNFLKEWKFVGIAFSGDINSQYEHFIDTFIIDGNEIADINEKSILDEDDYLAYFENIDAEKIASDISKSSSEINNILRNLDSQKRPILLSALMICLYPNDEVRDFINSYTSWDAETIITNIPTTVFRILKGEGVTHDKIKILTNELAFMETDQDLTSTNILKDILKELQDNVIPLFNKQTSYDIIGKFYEEFLRYAGVANVKKGIVLTPSHITDLFTDLIEIKANDVIFDPACGTGAFLISGMNKLQKIIIESNSPGKKEKLENIKTLQLLGFEKSSTMYSLAISNMLIRGDGKSQIYNEDFFSKKAQEILNESNLQPSIGFTNPPYGGADNSKKNPTKKEIQFLERMLSLCSRYGIIIAPLSTYFKDSDIRKRILSEHTLKYVINMPNDLFQPNASTYTAIAVFKTNIPHQYDKDKVIFYNLKNDGLILSKNKGRTDALNKWNLVKKELISAIKNPEEYQDNTNLVYKEILEDDEWIIQAHAKTDYKNLNESSFEKSIREYVVVKTKINRGIIDKDIDEITLLEILRKNNIDARSELDAE